MALPHIPDKNGLLDTVASPFELLKSEIRQLYEGGSPGGVRFRYALLLLDIVTVLFIIVTSFLPRSRAIESLDLVFGVLILADFSARLMIIRHPLQEFAHLSTWTGIVVIISFLAPFAGEAGGFLRTLRTLRLLRDVRMVARLRTDSSFFRQNEEVVFAVAKLAVFIFVMTGVVYETQKSHNAVGSDHPRAKRFSEKDHAQTTT
jgi:voltage-gated potassium channel